MRVFFTLFFLLSSLSFSADEGAALQESFLSSLLSSAQKLGADALENSACVLRQKALKTVDGMTVSVSADLLKLLPATRLLPASVSAIGEIAAFYKPGSDHINIQGFLVPSATVGHQAETASRKIPGDVNLGLTFGCDGKPGNYEGYFATVGVGALNLNLGLDLTEMFTNAMVATDPTFTSKSLGDYEKNLQSGHRDGVNGLGEISGRSSSYLDSFRSRFFPGSLYRPWHESRSSLERSAGLKNLENHVSGSGTTASSIHQDFNHLIGKMEANVDSKDLDANLDILTGVGNFYDKVGDYLQKTSHTTFPFLLKKAEREKTRQLFNPNPRLSGKTFSSVSWRRFYLSSDSMVSSGIGSREKALREATDYFNGGSYLCRSDARFVTFHLDYQYRASDLRTGHEPPLSRRTEPMVFDCITGRTLSNSGHRPSLDNFPEVRRLVSGYQSLLRSADENRKGIEGLQQVLNNTYADYRLKSKVQPRDLKIGGYHGGSALTGCNSVTVSVKDGVPQLGSLIGTAGALYGSVATAVPKSFSAVKSAVQGGLKSLGKVSASLSASHYYPVGPNYQLALKDLPIWFVRLLKGECGEATEVAHRQAPQTH